MKIYTLLFLFFSIFVHSQQLLNLLCENRYLVVKDEKFGVADSLNQIIFPIEYQMIEYKHQHFIVKKSDKFGLFTTDNKEILPTKFFFISERQNKRFFVAKSHYKRGLIDVNGHYIIEPKYRSVSAILDDYFYITQNDSKFNGIYDYNGKLVYPEEYKFFTIDNDKIFASKNEQMMILDVLNPEDSIVLDKDITFVYTNRHYIVNNSYVQLAKKNNLFGMINSDNEIIIPFIYEQIRSSNNWNYFIVKKNKKYGLIKIDGKIVKDPIFDFVEWFEDLIIFKRKGFENDVYYYQEKEYIILE